MRRASFAVSTCGMTMPSAPLSSARVASSIALAQTRTSGVTPVGNDAMQSCAISLTENEPCSLSRNSQSWPVAAASAGAAAVRR